MAQQSPAKTLCVEQLFDTESSAYTCLVWDEHSREALLIDPVDAQLQRDLNFLQTKQLRLVHVLETQAHADHITSAAALVEHTGAQATTPAGCTSKPPDVQLQDGDVLQLGGQAIKALHTPSPLGLVKPAANGSYAGDVSPQLAWQWWQSGQAVVVDVRTDAERAWVGFVPDALAIEWKSWPGMLMNPHFEAQLQARVAQQKAVLFLCRSGVRSIAAAQKATELGYRAYNILEGFEGDLDEEAHRGNRGGWRFHGLPWRQS